MAAGIAIPADRARARPGLLARVRRDPDLAFGLLLLALVAVAALAPGLLAPQSPFAVKIDIALEPPSLAHPFGTDDVGRDVFARVVHGARITLSICGGALLLSATAGGVLGLVSGFVGGRTDMALGRAVDVVLSFPPIILGIMITGILGPKTQTSCSRSASSTRRCSSGSRARGPWRRRG